MKYSTWGAQALPNFGKFTYLLTQAGKSTYCLIVQMGYQTGLSLRRATAKTLVRDRPQTSIAPQKYRIGEIVKFMPTGGLGIVTDAKYQSLFYGGQAISPRWMYLVEGVGDRQEWISEYTLNAYKPD